MTGDPRYLDYFRLFREGKFFEAHEVLESLWRATKGEEREFYQGLIQLAAALVHYQKNNLAGAKELYRKASRTLKPYPPNFGGVALSEFLKDFRIFLVAWSKNPKNPLLAKGFLPQVRLIKNAIQEKACPKKI